MTSLISNSTSIQSPFRFDTTPSGEADVDPDQIAILDNQGPNSDGWGSDGFGFKDVLDIINPLQHIPVVSSIYRAVTGDEIASAPRAIGGAIYGGPVGLLAAVSNNIVEAETGSDIAETAFAAFAGSRNDGVTSLARAAPSLQGTVSQAPIGPAPATPNPVAQSHVTQSHVAQSHVAQNPVSQGNTTSAPQLASVSSPTIQTPARETLIERLAKNPPAKGGGFIPSDAAARAGLFGLPQRPVPVSTQATNAAITQPVANRDQRLQSAPANALDRLIARSHAAQAERSGATSQETLQVPTDSNDVHGWMLRALGKYETMPKG